MKWAPAESPLRAAGVLARGAEARALGQRLLERDGTWQVAATSDVLIALGDDLPWIDGVVWLGMDSSAHGLWLPTTRAPSVDVALVARAVARKVGLPAVLLPDALYGLRELGPLHRPALDAWLAP